MNRIACSERDRLHSEYEQLIRTLELAVMTSTDESHIEILRAKCRTARAALDRHRAQHGCGPG
jgi:hypothetical protein